MTLKPMCRHEVSALIVAACSMAALTLPVLGGEPDGVKLAPIQVIDSKYEEGPNAAIVDPKAGDEGPHSDVGELLRNTPGVTSGRMGGHGLEIVIRGQQQNQISVIDSGSITYGACPNRMDPPTSSAASYRADRIIVQRGYASVTNGPGATGGAVILEREAPELSAKKRMSGSLSLGAMSNSETLEASGEVSVLLADGIYLEAGGDIGKANNYENGKGQEIRSAYKQRGGGVTLGYAKHGLDLAVDFERDRVTDALFAGAGMDSPLVDTTIYRLRGGMDLGSGALRRVEGNLFLSDVDHIMDNYSLRTPGMMAMLAPTQSKTYGGKLEAQFEYDRTTLTVGVDHQSNNRLAFGYMGMLALVDARDPSTQTGFSWPDVTIGQTGLYMEAETPLDRDTGLIAGLRYDHVRARAGKADDLPSGGGVSANTLYMARYGTTFDDTRTENNFAALLRVEHEIVKGLDGFVGLSQSVRTADTSERAMARNNWVGNPDIKPEKHRQIDVGLDAGNGQWHGSVSGYFDWVSDYILNDQFTVPGVALQRNVSARIGGIELAGGWLWKGFSLESSLTFTRGRNVDDDRDIAQIPPLNGLVSASYGGQGWRAGARLNWSATQTFIDPARDPGETAGWATLDLYGSIPVSKIAVLRAGVNNVTDATYANHLSRSNAFDPALVQVDEPGRSFFVKLDAQF